MTPVPSSPVALLDQLDELRAKADIVPLRQTLGDLYTDRGGRKVATGPNGMMLLGHDAALIVGAVNVVGPLADAVRAVLAVCAEIEQEQAKHTEAETLTFHGLGQLSAISKIRAAVTAALSVTP